MKKLIQISCDDSLEISGDVRFKDSKNYQNYKSGRSPFSKNSDSLYIRHFQHCQTPKQKNRSKSPIEFKSPKYQGIIQKKLLQRLNYYDKINQNTQIEAELASKMKGQLQSMKEIRQKPQINIISQLLYQKVKNQRKLSPNVLDRFKTYQYQKVQRQTRKQLLKMCNFNVKHDVATCRNVLKQTNFQRSKSKSCTKLIYSTSSHIKNKQNVGKLVKTNQNFNKAPIKQNAIQPSTLHSSKQKEKTFYRTDTKSPKNSHNKIFEQFYKKETKYLQQKQANQLLDSIEHQSSPFKKTKHNSKKWHVSGHN